MTWWQFLILILVLFVDQVAHWGRKMKGGIQVYDYHLANDPEFIEKVADAVRESYQRKLKTDLQTRLDYDG